MENNRFKSEQAAQEAQQQLEDEWADILFVPPVLNQLV